MTLTYMITNIYSEAQDMAFRCSVKREMESEAAVRSGAG